MSDLMSIELLFAVVGTVMIAGYYWWNASDGKKSGKDSIAITTSLDDPAAPVFLDVAPIFVDYMGNTSKYGNCCNLFTVEEHTVDTDAANTTHNLPLTNIIMPAPVISDTDYVSTDDTPMVLVDDAGVSPTTSIDPVVLVPPTSKKAFPLSLQAELDLMAGTARMLVEKRRAAKLAAIKEIEQRNEAERRERKAAKKKTKDDRKSTITT